MTPMKTKDVKCTRGQTMAFTFTVKNAAGSRIDLTGAHAYLWVTADMKVAATIKLADVVTAGHRIGIVFADQTGENRGEFTATFIPSDTAALVALGDDDPYLYDVWIVDSTGAKFPVIATSRFALYPQVTTAP